MALRNVESSSCSRPTPLSGGSSIWHCDILKELLGAFNASIHINSISMMRNHVVSTYIASRTRTCTTEIWRMLNKRNDGYAKSTMKDKGAESLEPPSKHQGHRVLTKRSVPFEELILLLLLFTYSLRSLRLPCLNFHAARLLEPNRTKACQLLHGENEWTFE